jgi:hypothetical protein
VESLVAEHDCGEKTSKSKQEHFKEPKQGWQVLTSLLLKWDTANYTKPTIFPLHTFRHIPNSTGPVIAKHEMGHIDPIHELEEPPDDPQACA